MFHFNKLRFNGVLHPEKGNLLNKHSVAFHGSGNNILRSKLLLNRAGIEVLRVAHHDYDLVPNVIGLNTIKDRMSTRLNSSHVAFTYVFICVITKKI